MAAVRGILRDFSQRLIINYRQLEWFRAQAKSEITFDVRIYCKSLSVKPKDEDKSLLVMSWNGKVTDFKRTSDNPMFYSIIPGTDGCKDVDSEQEEFKHTDIRFKGTPNYLPITDVYIRNIKTDKEQSVFAEPIKLCAKF